MKKFRVGLVGCGAISRAYLNHAPNYDILEIAACADLNPESAKKLGEEFSIPKICSVDELLADDSIDCVLNLTIPKAHAPVALQAIEAGKHVYSEKPLGINRDEAKQVVDAAAAKGVRVGNAPDTFLGAGHQTARKLIDDGAIGRPVVATAYMMSRGVETWHPNPPFYYQVGGGPMFDMGPYYITDLINLLGAPKRVASLAKIAIPDRVITHKNRKTGEKLSMYGQKIDVETPDHVAGTMEFENGLICTMITSFACYYAQNHPITIFGTEGTIKVPDPNGFDGAVHLRKAGDEDWTEMPMTHRTGHARASGLAEMGHAIHGNRPHRASGELALGVVDVMQGFLDSGETGNAYEFVTDFPRPAALPTELPDRAFD